MSCEKFSHPINPNDVFSENGPFFLMRRNGGIKDNLAEIPCSFEEIQDFLHMSFGKELPDQLNEAMAFSSLNWYYLEGAHELDYIFMGTQPNTLSTTDLQGAIGTIRVKREILPLRPAHPSHPRQDIYGEPLNYQVFSTSLGVAGVVNGRVVGIDYVGGDMIGEDKQPAAFWHNPPVRNIEISASESECPTADTIFETRPATATTMPLLTDVKSLDRTVFLITQAMRDATGKGKGRHRKTMRIQGTGYPDGQYHFHFCGATDANTMHGFVLHDSSLPGLEISYTPPGKRTPKWEAYIPVEMQK